MRLFIAINFTEQIKDELFHIGMNLKKQMDKGNILRKDNFHITLVIIFQKKNYENP